ncbi:MAG: ABC transporter permease [Oscillospiraceae bacterium]|jgi:putative ABC transport system permease protein|nr:ABC transporter permease [Oscillospiraceae bacterium]
MKLMNSLALRHLQKNKKQALSAFLAITLATSMLVAVSSFCFSVYDSYVRFAQANGLMDTMSDSIGGLAVVGVLLGGVIAAAAIIVISNAFDIQAGERIQQFGILKSVGAEEKQIRATVTAEGGWLSLVGIPAGIVLGHLLCFIALFVLRGYTGEGADGSTMEYALRFNLVAVLLAAALSYASVRFASSLTAQRVSKLPAIEAIRQTNEIKIDGKNLKTSKLIGKLFGFEGTLAAKQLKRSKRKFRVTVLSLVTSIVLFLSAFSFGDTLIKTALGAYANTGANVVSQVIGNSSDFSKFDRYEAMLKSHGPKGMRILYSYGYYGQEWYYIISMDDGDYAAYCKQAGVKQGANILLNLSDRTVPFDVALADLGGVILPVTEKSSVTNPYLKNLTMTSYPTILVPKDVAQKLNVPIEAHYFISAENAVDFIAAIKTQDADFGFDNVYHHNTEEYTREEQRLYAMLMMFVYCFVGMLALIGATSVLATINSNINLRRSEFAMLRAVGMETKRLHRMLRLESLLYGIKSLLYGLPTGLLLSYGMYKLAISSNTRLSDVATAQFHYEIPYIGILACVLGVFAVNGIAMYFAAGKIRRSNIAESMRELNC